eukprot:3951743-Prymnesium_polylepis.1
MMMRGLVRVVMMMRGPSCTDDAGARSGCNDDEGARAGRNDDEWAHSGCNGEWPTHHGEQQCHVDGGE